MKSASVRFAGARTCAREKSGSDLHAFGAERECCRKASPAKWRLDDGVSVTAVTRE